MAGTTRQKLHLWIVDLETQMNQLQTGNN